MFFFCVGSNAQDTIAAVEKNSTHYTDKDIRLDNSNVTQVKFSPKFKEKYTDSEFQYEIKIEEKGLWDRFVEWIQYLLKTIFGLSDGISPQGIDITLKIVAGAIILYVIYLIVKIVLNKEGQWVFGKSSTKKIIEHDDIERNLQHVDFEKLIAATLRSGDQRLAIRYYYLWLLKKMSEKNIIDWNPEKTNSDYFYEIKNEALKQDFSYASYLYNYIWYGEFEITDAGFESIKKTFETTLQSVR